MAHPVPSSEKHRVNLHVVGPGRGQESRRACGGYVLVLAMITLLIVIILMMGTLRDFARNLAYSMADGKVTVYCAAGLRKPLEEMAAAFTAETGTRVAFQYGGSGTLLGQIKVNPQAADLYLSADDGLVEQGLELGLLAEVIPIAEMTPILILAPDLDLELQTLADLERLTRPTDTFPAGQLRLGLANADATAIGRTSRELLHKAGLWQRLSLQVKVFKPTVNDLCNDVDLGSLDAAIVWDAVAQQYPRLKSIALPEFAQASRAVSMAVVQTSEVPQLALKFARYVAAFDRGGLVFRRMGYTPSNGDLWAEHPKLTLFAGAMLNKAIDSAVHEFCQREGVEVSRVYNGCGILVSQMNAGVRADAYFSCDQSFMDVVAERFGPPIMVSENQMVLVTQKGNPHDLHKLASLSQAGLRVGLAHPEKSALGSLTRKLLQAEGAWDSLQASGNLKQQAPQGDLLMTAMAAGALDAVVVYASNAAAHAGNLEILSLLDGLDPERQILAIAVQPFAISNKTPYAQTTARLMQALTTSAMQKRFEDLGFQWTLVHD